MVMVCSGMAEGVRCGMEWCCLVLYGLVFDKAGISDNMNRETQVFFRNQTNSANLVSDNMKFSFGIEQRVQI